MQASYWTATHSAQVSWAPSLSTGDGLCLLLESDLCKGSWGKIPPQKLCGSLSGQDRSSYSLVQSQTISKETDPGGHPGSWGS